MPNPFAFTNGDTKGGVPDPLASPASDYLAADATWKSAIPTFQTGADPGTAIAHTSFIQCASITASKTGLAIIAGVVTTHQLTEPVAAQISINGTPLINTTAPVVQQFGANPDLTCPGIVFMSPVTVGDVITLEGSTATGAETTIANVNALQMITF